MIFVLWAVLKLLELNFQKNILYHPLNTAGSKQQQPFNLVSVTFINPYFQ